jgi:hypothetical protein
MRRFLRYLRIAWSVGFCILSLLLIALWVQSYSSVYQVYIRPGFISAQGYIYISGSGITLTASDLFWNSVHRVDGLLKVTSHGSGISIPDGCLLLFAGAFTAMPWLPYRFSLRTLLIATTLVAAVLGLVVYFR